MELSLGRHIDRMGETVGHSVSLGMCLRCIYTTPHQPEAGQTSMDQPNDRRQDILCYFQGSRCALAIITRIAHAGDGAAYMFACGLDNCVAKRCDWPLVCLVFFRA